jgi:hypothetical protein
MADQYDILGFDMYDISGPQAWPREHGLTSDDKVAGMPVYMRTAHSSGGPELNEPRPIGIWGPKGAWDRSRGINRYDVLEGPHHGGHHHGGGRGYPVAYYPADTYEVVYEPLEGVRDCKGIRLRNGRCITSDEILSGFLQGRDYISSPRMCALAQQRGYVGGSLPGDIIYPKGWGPNPINLTEAFRLVHKRAPTADETANLVWYRNMATLASAESAKGHDQQNNERNYWNYLGFAEFYTKNLKRADDPHTTLGHSKWLPGMQAQWQAIADNGNAIVNKKVGAHRGFFGNLVHDIGSAVHTVTHAAAAVYSGVENLASKIPVLGTPLHAALQLAGGNIVHTIDSIASGANISKAALSSLKDELTNANTIAQYATVVTSAIPGLGTIGAGVSAALAAAHAISQGKPITEALVSAVKDAAIRAIPGGALVQKAASEAFEIGKSVAHGERIDHIALDRARAQVPANLRPVFDAGLAIEQGKKVQDALVKGVVAMGSAQLSKLASDGEKLLKYSTPLRMAALAIGGDARKGFHTATAILAHTGVPITAVTALRNKLPMSQRAGFDKAVAEHAKIFNAFRRV